MSRTLPIDHAPIELRGLVRSMQPGDEIVLTDNEKPVARLVTDAPPASNHGLGAWKGKLEIRDDGKDVILDHFKDYLP